MKSLVFDSGPIISMAMNNLLWILEPLKEKFGGEFYITPRVRYEVIERPMKINRFKYEAIQVLKLVEKGILKEIKTGRLNELSDKLLECSNKMYCLDGKCVTICHRGEMETIAAAIMADAKAIVIDERTTRMLIEQPQKLHEIIERKNHTKLKTNTKCLKQWQEQTYGLKVIRSTELAATAYELGLLSDQIPDIKEGKKQLLDGILWGLRINGCSISAKEIAKIEKITKDVIS